MARCREMGYSVYLHFIYVQNLVLSRARVVQRVKMGGHGVPEDDQIRRFNRSFANLKSALDLSNTGMIYDNSSASHELVAIYDHGHCIYKKIEDAWLP